jgi:energy-coupling factor transporter ATP-binding protein EcfA2
MAQIREFTIEGLAGRTEPSSAVLNPDVNVFFGLNGSGKTTLLKILHAALSTQTDILKDLPFTRATVKVYLNRYSREFVRTYIPLLPAEAEVVAQTSLPFYGGGLPTSSEASRADSRFVNLSTLSNLVFDEELKKVVEKPKWVSDPLEPDGTLTAHHFGFLPLSRLYRNVSTSSGAKRLSDQELDNAFANSLQKQWSEYYSDISLETAKTQGKGLANILRFFLVGAQDQDELSAAPDEKEAYKRISGFLERQPGFDHLLPNEEKFAAIYAKKPELRNVVRQIEQVETTIGAISAPRERFRNVLESMFTGSKHLVFTEKEIKVKLSSDREIGLPLLSSGEKQLLFIALFALMASNHALIIDEPELSMHVEWQRKLVDTLRVLNPRVQLIMATHSPEIMADLPDDKIFRL